MNHAGGSYLIAVAALACTGISLDHDRQRPERVDTGSQHARRGEVCFAENSVRGSDARCVERLESLATRKTEHLPKAATSGNAISDGRRYRARDAKTQHVCDQDTARHRTNAATNGDRDGGTTSRKVWPVFERQLGIFNELR